MEQVILVDENDVAVGAMEKMEAHRRGVLHRAFSVLVFNTKGELLIQKRAQGKYHSGGLWTNTCCSHPGPSEDIIESARRRTKYEMGVDVEPVFAFKFIYQASLDHGLIEHELDHVFTATFDGTPHVNPDEVEDWKYVDLKLLRDDVKDNPERYTVWFGKILEKLRIKN
ncbi:isopentenyl-diphosphate Delta-isomerase [Chryseolinea sp. T2]|uniref:isopentenyl-diphosphate Delta-isomerase n=1 Tax=Chryseolinea sp. T2 TaxID=3129255 RepID=UPI0030786349